jgi:ELWxxDGT repeat protein
LPDDLFLGPSGLLFHEWSRAARGLHVTDGTAEGTHLLATVDGASARFVTSGGRVAFVASDAAHGCEVRTTDGTPEGTALLKDAAAGAQDGIFDVPVTHWQSEHFRSRPLDLDGRLLFSAGSPSRAWVSDGTQAGTMLLQPTDGSTGPLIPHAWATHGSSAFFLAGDEGYELHLWRTDGTSESTTSLALLRFHCPLPSGWLVSDGRRLFALVRAVRGKQVDLFTSDGTSAGTTYLRSFPEAGTDDRMNNDPLPELPALVPLEGGGVLFVANDGDHGREPWFSDGTLSGTRLVADIVPGPHGSEPHELARFGRWVVFAARDEAHGVEPWATDGTQDRTVRLADVERGIEPSLPREFTLSGGLVYFSARDAVHGRELWAMRLDTDDDGMLDVTDPCPDVADAGADSDADGAGDACDAAPADASVQALPREVRSLDVASQSGGVRLTWENQSDETGVGVRYDVLEGALGPGSLTPTTCVVRDMAETLADVAATGSRWWLVRARAAGFTATYGSSLADGLGDCN